VLMCFRESDGKFLWQQTNEKLADSNKDWPETGVCSAPLVEGGRVYYVTNPLRAGVPGYARQVDLEARHDQGAGRVAAQ